jgi:hypothetical protein
MWQHVLCDRDEITSDALRYRKFMLYRSELGRTLHDRFIGHLAQFGSHLLSTGSMSAVKSSCTSWRWAWV